MKNLKRRTISLLAAGGMIISGAGYAVPETSLVSAYGSAPMDFTITLEDYDFTLKKGETITIDDLKEHGMKVYIRNAVISDMPTDPMIYVRIPISNQEIYEREYENDHLVVKCPEKFRNGENTIIVEGEFSGFLSDYCVTSFDINVTLDGAEEEMPEIPNGDINNDGITDMTDLSGISLLLLRDADIKEVSASGDIDGNGSLELADISLFKQYISHIKEVDLMEDSGCYTTYSDEKYYWKLYTSGKLEISDREFGGSSEEKQLYDIKDKVRSLYVIDGTTRISNLSGMYALKKVYLPESIEYIGDSSFRNCTSLNQVIIKCKPDYVSADAFFNTPYLNNNTDEFFMIGNVLHRYNGDKTEVNIPDGVTGISGLAFYKKDKIKKVSIPSTVTFIGNNAFSECESLESVNIPKGVKTIEKAAFSDTKSLKKIIIPNGVEIIEELAFSGSGIENIIIPRSVKRIKYGAFSYCDNLEKVNIMYRKTSISNMFSEHYQNSVVTVEGKQIEDVTYYNYRDYFPEDPEPDEDGFKDIMQYIEMSDSEIVKNEKLADDIVVQCINEDTIKKIKIIITSENENIEYFYTNPQINEDGKLRIFFSKYITGEPDDNSVINTYEFWIHDYFWEGKELTENDIEFSMGEIS